MNITRRSPVFLETLSFSSRKAWRKTKMEGLASFVGAYTNPYEDCLEALMEEFAAKKREHIAKHTYVSLYDKLTKFAKIKSQCDGDRRLKQLKETLDKFQWARTKDQFLFHEDFIRICLPHIYGPQEFEANRIRLMDAFGLQSMKVGALILCPRRWGKTVAVAMFIAAMMIVCDGITIATFSAGQRASSGLMTHVVKFVYEIANASKRIVSKNEEVFMVACPDQVKSNGELIRSKYAVRDSGRVNKLFAFPANANVSINVEEFVQKFIESQSLLEWNESMEDKRREAAHVARVATEVQRGLINAGYPQVPVTVRVEHKTTVIIGAQQNK